MDVVSTELAMLADETNKNTRRLVEIALEHIGTRPGRGDMLTTSCPPFRDTRAAIVHGQNMALKLFDIACAARQIEVDAGANAAAGVEEEGRRVPTPLSDSGVTAPPGGGGLVEERDSSSTEIG